MYTSVSIFVVVSFQCGEHTKLYSGSITVLLHGPDDLNGNKLAPLLVSSLDNFAKCPLAKEFRHLVYICVSNRPFS